MTTSTSTPSPTPTPVPGGQVGRKPEILVVPLDNFEIIGMDDKLNLLVSAINKMNTKFHNKLDELQKKLTKQVLAFEPHITAMEMKYETLLGSVDDLETNYAMVSELKTKISMLEDACAIIKDDIEMLKELVRV